MRRCPEARHDRAGSGPGAGAAGRGCAGREQATPIAGQKPAGGSQSSTPPLRGSRGGGRGKSDSSRSRAPSPEELGPQGPPPPQEPPRPHPADALIAQLAYVVVNEAGASVYSTSQVGREELPDSDATLRSGISIGRRLQDPVIRAREDRASEYRRRSLPARHQSQASQGIARDGDFELRELRRRRREHGQCSPAPARLRVSISSPPGESSTSARNTGPSPGASSCSRSKGSDRRSYTQAAGFLKIQDGEQPLDRTWIHPESYGVATRLLEKLGYAAGSRSRQGETGRAPRASWPKSMSASLPASSKPANSRCATSSTALPAPSATRATIFPSRFSRKAS